jgi:exopolyphosphatase / guanosine-5'-triphosphate,3'-diphosphate pyrophosphatase
VCDHRGVEPSVEAVERPFAVVDVGSNSARMIVFRMREGEHLDVIEDARAPLRLARNLRDSDELGPEAIERTLEALRDFVAVARGAGAGRIIAVATSAVRDASDGHVLIERARSVGVMLQTIDGDHEARLGFYGAVHDLPVESGYTMDVGGGSVELSRFEHRRLDASWTFPLGSLRMSDRFLLSDPPTGKEQKALREAVREALAEARISPLDSGQDLIGIGGTVRNLAKIDLRRTDYPLPLLHGYQLDTKRLDQLVTDLAARSMARRAQVSGLNPDRVDTIVGGGLVVAEIAAHIGADKLTVSSRGLREGLALATEGGGVPSPAWVRTISVATLAARFATWEAAGAHRRAALALALHSALDPDAPSNVTEMVGHAATLLDIGRAIDYYDRFEHTAAIVTAADLAGFTHADLGSLTAILRQADDQSTLGPYARLVENKQAVLHGATALGLADELNRRIPPGEPAPISCNWLRAGFEIVAPVPAGWRPRGIAERFRKVFGKPLLIVANEPNERPIEEDLAGELPAEATTERGQA